MILQDKIVMVRTLVDEGSTADSLITVYLKLAESKIFNRMYPLGVPTTVTDVPTKYEMLQCELAARLYLKRGAEGETAHKENGIDRTYGSTNDEDLLKEVVQVIVREH